VREGFAVSLSHDAEKETAPDNPRPFVHQMLSHSGTPNAGSHSDSFTVAHHGLAHTHLDSLCHFFWNGKMYNGVPVSEVTAQGARKLAVTNAKTGIYARAVLMDIAELKGVPYLEPGTAVYPEDLDAWEKKSGARVGPGDVLLLRTGRWAHRAAKGALAPQRLSGLHATCIPWLKKRDIAVLGSDAASDVRPSGVDGVSQPIHIFTLAGLGAWILDNGDYEAVAQAAKQRKRWEFLITAAPLAVPGATGSAMNPIAIF
jgi:kynurenine formamidase